MITGLKIITDTLNWQIGQLVPPNKYQINRHARHGEMSSAIYTRTNEMNMSTLHIQTKYCKTCDPNQGFIVISHSVRLFVQVDSAFKTHKQGRG